eukprot:352872-Chlamydomonas_euryale.AAC.2
MYTGLRAQVHVHADALSCTLADPHEICALASDARKLGPTSVSDVRLCVLRSQMCAHLRHGTSAAATHNSSIDAGGKWVGNLGAGRGPRTLQSLGV